MNGLIFDPSRNTCDAWTAQDVKILKADSFEEMATPLPYAYSNVEAMQSTPDTKHILLALRARTLVLWDIAASAVVQELTIDLPESIVYARISNNCRIIHVRDSANTHNVIHLAF
jgi:hypothetical protein